MDLNQALNLQKCNINLNQYKDYYQPPTQYQQLPTQYQHQQQQQQQQQQPTQYHQQQQSQLPTQQQSQYQNQTHQNTRQLDLQTQDAKPVNNFASRIFDINPSTLKYKSTDDPHVELNGTPYKQLIPMGQTPGALPETIGQSLLIDQSYFPNPISPYQPQSEMSQAYLQMKQAQEQQSLSEKCDSNPAAIERLKTDQALELQKNLQQQGNFGSGPLGMDSLNPTIYANTSGSKSMRPIAYNAQGESVNDRATLYQDKKFNKYGMLKEMSPEMLNKMYGRQSDQSVSPKVKEASGDIYDQTSCYKTPQEWSQQSHHQLKKSLIDRQAEILAQKAKQGIQSFNTFTDSGTTLNEAFR